MNDVEKSFDTNPYSPSELNPAERAESVEGADGAGESSREEVEHLLEAGAFDQESSGPAKAPSIIEDALNSLLKLSDYSLDNEGHDATKTYAPSALAEHRFSDGGPEESRRPESEALQQFHLAWVESPNPALESFVPAVDKPHRKKTLLELIKLDQKWRCRSAAPLALEAYLDDWPELRSSTDAVTDLLASECRWRAVFLAPPDRAEIDSRFPEISESIKLKKIVEDADPTRLKESIFESARFFLLRRLGAGGMGVVYEVLDRQLGKPVALKVLPNSDPKRLDMFRKEFRTSSAITHTNLVSLYELLSFCNEWFFTMELVHGQDFLSYVRDDETGALAEQRIADLPPINVGRLRSALRQLVEGLHALHTAAKLHRDIKASNVLVTPDGQVVILDFGVVANLLPVTEIRSSRGPTPAVPAESGQRYSTDCDVMGTRAYMSPEQAAGKRLTAASDWYTVGVMLYRSLTGRKPVYRQGKGDADELELVSPLEINDQAPADLSQLTCALLQENPTARPTAEAILEYVSDGEGLPSDSSLRTIGCEELPFVGRSSQIAELQRGFDHLAAGQTAIVHVRGPSGAGKSRLIEEFLHQAETRENAVILGGRCYERESVPYKALDSLIESAIRHLEALSDEELQDILPRNVDALARVFPMLKRVPAINEVTVESSFVSDPQQVRQRAFGALREMLLNWSQRQDLVLFIDDLQWGDVDSAAILRELISPPDPPRLLVIISYRSEQIEHNACLEALKLVENDAAGGVQRLDVQVGALAPQETRSLVELLVSASQGLSEAVIHRIVEDSRGMPYFVAELVRQAKVHGNSHEHSIDLDDVLWYRIRELPDQRRCFMETLAVAGQPLSVRIVVDAADVPNFDPKDLNYLRSAQLVRTTGPNVDDEVEVFHDRIRESVTARLDRNELTSHHCRLGETLEACEQIDPETVAIHFHAAGQAEKACHHFTLAADEATEKLAFQLATRLYRQALDLRPTHGDEKRSLYTKLGNALAYAGLGEEAATAYQTASQEVEGLDRLSLQRDSAYQYLITGHVDKGRAAFEEVLKTVGMKMQHNPQKALVSLLLRRAWLRLRGLGFRERKTEEIPKLQLARLDTCWSLAIGLSVIDVIRAADFQVRGLIKSLRAGDPQRIARALALEVVHNAANGTWSSPWTAKLLAAAEEVGQRVGSDHCHGLLLLARGGSAFMEGRFLEAAELNSRAVELFRSRCRGVTWELDTAHTYLQWSLINLGEMKQLSTLCPELIKEAQERGDLYAGSNLKAYAMPNLLLVADEPSQAWQMVDEALAEWSQEEFHVQSCLALVARIDIELYRGRGKTAWQRITTQWPEFTRSLMVRIQHARMQLHYSRARSGLLAAFQGADPTTTLKIAEGDARRLERERRIWGHAMGHVIRAGLASYAGEEASVKTHLQQARQLFEKGNSRLQAAAIRRQLGRLPGGDEALVREADEWMMQQGVKNPERIADMYVPLRR